MESERRHRIPNQRTKNTGGAVRYAANTNTTGRSNIRRMVDNSKRHRDRNNNYFDRPVVKYNILRQMDDQLVKPVHNHPAK